MEFLLIGLSGCITTTFVANAAARGIEIRSLESELEGDIDIRVFLDLDASVPTGYKEIRFTFAIDADASVQDLQELAQYARNHSPVASTIMEKTPINVSINKK